MAQDMFRINRYRYINHGKVGRGARLEVFARTREFADKLVARMNKALGYNLKPKLFGFVKRFYTPTPPYEIECDQEESMDELERKVKEHEPQK